MPHIDIRNLRKTYRRSVGGPWRRTNESVDALRGIDLQVENGELVGLIGPNGAGKSTLVKILAGILVPDSGHCTVGGKVPWKERRSHVADIGVVFGQRSQLWWDLPTVDSFRLLQAVYKIPAPLYQERMDTLSTRLGLGSLLHVPVRQLSLGQRMRCEIAAALLHRPPLLFLDEPTIGLDADSKLAVRSFIRELHHSDRTTVILTTHDIADIEALCRRVVVVAGGTVLSDGPLQWLRDRHGRHRELTVECDDDIADPQAQWVRREGNRTTLRFDPAEISAPALIARLSERQNLRDITIETVPIEEVVASAYRESVG